jgi:hypothetical protein
MRLGGRPRLKKVLLIKQDLTRPNLAQCAIYLTMKLTANQEAAFLQLGTGGSLIAADEMR